MFVFTRVAKMWLQFMQKDEVTVELARRRLAALRYQLTIGQAILAEHAEWTSQGCEFFSALTDVVGEIQTECNSLSLSNVEPIYSEVASLGRSNGTAAHRQLTHIRRWREQHSDFCVSAERAVNMALRA